MSILNTGKSTIAGSRNLYPCIVRKYLFIFMLVPEKTFTKLRSDHSKVKKILCVTCEEMADLHTYRRCAEKLGTTVHVVES